VAALSVLSAATPSVQPGLRKKLRVAVLRGQQARAEVSSETIEAIPERSRGLLVPLADRMGLNAVIGRIGQLVRHTAFTPYRRPEPKAPCRARFEQRARTAPV
jgi:hypothetical protein